MANRNWDVIVVGGRCAGAPTAMLTARAGYRVLVVDKAGFPSDTPSTHLVHPPGVRALAAWGLLDRVAATGCPPIDTYLFDFGPFVISGTPGTDDCPVAYAPRRSYLDAILLEAAAEAGAEVRQGFTVEELVMENGRVTGIRGRGRDGRTVAETAQVVVGADGRHSMVARGTNAGEYKRAPKLLSAYYAYFSGLPMHGRCEQYVRPLRGFAAWPTNDGLTVVIAGWPFSEFENNRKDVEGNFWRTLELSPEFAHRVRSARREERFVGVAVPNYFRKPFGPGWALVGDAGYQRDFITAQGIQDAFHDAVLCSTALDEALSGTRPFDEAMGTYQARRDERVGAMFEFTCGIATMEPPPPEVQQLLYAAHQSRHGSDQFCQMAAGVISPADFFSAENAARLTAPDLDRIQRLPA